MDKPLIDWDLVDRKMYILFPWDCFAMGVPRSKKKALEAEFGKPGPRLKKIPRNTRYPEMSFGLDG